MTAAVIGMLTVAGGFVLCFIAVDQFERWMRRRADRELERRLRTRYRQHC